MYIDLFIISIPHVIEKKNAKNYSKISTFDNPFKHTCIYKRSKQTNF